MSYNVKTDKPMKGKKRKNSEPSDRQILDRMIKGETLELSDLEKLVTAKQDDEREEFKPADAQKRNDSNEKVPKTALAFNAPGIRLEPCTVTVGSIKVQMIADNKEDVGAVDIEQPGKSKVHTELHDVPADAKKCFTTLSKQWGIARQTIVVKNKTDCVLTVLSHPAGLLQHVLERAIKANLGAGAQGVQAGFEHAIKNQWDAGDTQLQWVGGKQKGQLFPTGDKGVYVTAIHFSGKTAEEKLANSDVFCVNCCVRPGWRIEVNEPGEKLGQFVERMPDMQEIFASVRKV